MKIKHHPPNQPPVSPSQLPKLRRGAIAAFALFAGLSSLSAQQTIGGGTLSNPAQGPAAAFGLGEGATLVKNWDFGTNGTIKNMADMDAEFKYHDQLTRSTTAISTAHLRWLPALPLR